MLHIVKNVVVVAETLFDYDMDSALDVVVVAASHHSMTYLAPENAKVVPLVKMAMRMTMKSAAVDAVVAVEDP